MRRLIGPLILLTLVACGGSGVAPSPTAQLAMTTVTSVPLPSPTSTATSAPTATSGTLTPLAPTLGAPVITPTDTPPLATSVPAITVPATPAPPTRSPATAARATSRPIATPTAATNGFQVTASVSNATPTDNSRVTVTARLTKDGTGVAGATMSTSWDYKTTTSACSGGPSGADGSMSCTRDISRATKGFTVTIAVTVTYQGQTFRASTAFTPR